MSKKFEKLSGGSEVGYGLHGTTGQLQVKGEPVGGTHPDALRRDDVRRAWTPEELRQSFLEYCDQMCRMWERDKDSTPEQKVRGVVHSILTGIDGMTDSLPPITMTADIDPVAKQDAIDGGDDWIEDGTVVNPGDKLLHDVWGKEFAA